ncbi:hypothetical protein MRX96_056044 [Rhipicephalus microplus]
MDASPPVVDALCAGEQQPESTANGGDETPTNAKVSARDRGEVTAENIEATVDDVQLERQHDDRRSTSPVHSSSEDSSCSDESSPDGEDVRPDDLLRPSLFVDSVGYDRDLNVSGTLRKHYPASLRRTLPKTVEFQTIYDMTRTFVRHFTTLHVERECDAHGVYVCVACSSAQRTLAEIREAIGRDGEGRSIALKNTNFMKLLVRLCNLKSPDATRICTISSRKMRAYYESAASCKIVGTATLLEDEQSEKLWKRFFGAAASTIKKITYTVKLRGIVVPIAPDTMASTIFWKRRRSAVSRRLTRTLTLPLRPTR